MDAGTRRMTAKASQPNYHGWPVEVDGVEPGFRRSQRRGCR